MKGLRRRTGPSIVYHIDLRLLRVVVHESIEVVVSLTLPAGLSCNLGFPFNGIRIAIVPYING
jgi:hypothetical protein